MAGIKETMELFLGLDAQFDAIIAACADGKISINDLKHQLPIMGKLKDAFAGVKDIVPELKDLDAAEIETLVDEIAVTGAKMVSAFMALSAILAK